MSDELEKSFFDWVLKNKDWRVDYVHKVGFKAIGLSVSPKGTPIKKEIIFDMQGEKSAFDVLTEAQGQAKSAVENEEPMVMFMIPKSLESKYAGLLQQLLDKES